MRITLTGTIKKMAKPPPDPLAADPELARVARKQARLTRDAIAATRKNGRLTAADVRRADAAGRAFALAHGKRGGR